MWVHKNRQISHIAAGGDLLEPFGGASSSSSVAAAAVLCFERDPYAPVVAHVWFFLSHSPRVTSRLLLPLRIMT